MVGVILAAGDGSRLQKGCEAVCCKPLTKIKDKALILYALDNLSELKVQKAYIVVGKQGDLIKSALGDEYKGISLEFVHQPQQKGLMNAFLTALNIIEGEKPVVLQLADEIFIDFKGESVKNSVTSMDCDFYCGITFEEDSEKIKGNFSVELKEDSLLTRCVEKPKTVINNIKGTGFTVFGPCVQGVIKELYKSAEGQLPDLCDCFNYLIEKGYYGKALVIAQKEFNINTVDDLYEAEACLKQ